MQVTFIESTNSYFKCSAFKSTYFDWNTVRIFFGLKEVWAQIVSVQQMQCERKHCVLIVTLRWSYETSLEGNVSMVT